MDDRELHERLERIQKGIDYIIAKVYESEIKKADEQDEVKKMNEDLEKLDKKPVVRAKAQ